MSLTTKTYNLAPMGPRRWSRTSREGNRRAISPRRVSASGVKDRCLTHHCAFSRDLSNTPRISASSPSNWTVRTDRSRPRRRSDMLALVGEAKQNSGKPRPQIIHCERKWFEGIGGGAVNMGEPRISASRRVGHAAERGKRGAEIEADCHVVGVALQPMTDVTLYAAGKLISTGHLPRGSMRVNQPGLPRRGIFRGAYDVLHLHVPNAIMVEYASSKCGHARSAPLIAERPTVDPVIERLARSLIHAEELGGAFGQSYADGISLDR